MFYDLWVNVEKFISMKAGKFEGLAEKEDLCQQAFLILYDAAMKYKADRDCKFLTYLGHCLDWEWQRWIDDNGTVRIPCYMNENIRKYAGIQKKYKLDHGCDAPDCVVCDAMQISAEELGEIKKTVLLAKLKSLDDESFQIYERPDTTMFEEDVIDRMMAEELWSIVDGLDPMQSSVIRKRYKNNLSVRTCAEELGISSCAVRSREEKALRRLYNMDRIRAYNDEIRSRALRGNSMRNFNQTNTSSTERAAIWSLKHTPRMGVKG